MVQWLTTGAGIISAIGSHWNILETDLDRQGGAGRIVPSPQSPFSRGPLL